jgi:hypothetical protein
MKNFPCLVVLVLIGVQYVGAMGQKLGERNRIAGAVRPIAQRIPAVKKLLLL